MCVFLKNNKNENKYCFVRVYSLNKITKYLNMLNFKNMCLKQIYQR